ncbi:ATP-binding protein [Pseudoclavibacter sp. JSM 162008]|uniref:ATP-binding protein n=1 Tax=Pseudoclavibacter sp. JSM 162008 TaxID=3229855 RepID=UPI0035268C56
MAGVSLTLREEQDSPDPHTVLTELLVEIGRAARRRGGTAVLVHIDEIQNISSGDVISQVFVALGDALVHEEPEVAPGGMNFTVALPIAVYLSGLPEFEDVAGARQGATFVRRFQKTTLAPIEDDDLLAALQPFVTEGWPVLAADGSPTRIFMEPAAQQQIVELSHGEPFLFQLAGERAWYADTGNVITRDHVLAGWQHARDEAEAHVERILERLPQREREFLHAMAELPVADRKLTQIARALGHERATEDGTIAQRLDRKRGILQRGPSTRSGTELSARTSPASGPTFPRAEPHKRVK